jgi:hypothetical protein
MSLLLLPQPTLLDEATITRRLVVPLLNAMFKPAVPSQIFVLYHPVAGYNHTKTNTALFLAEWPLKLVHKASLSSTSRTTALWGNLRPF